MTPASQRCRWFHGLNRITVFPAVLKSQLPLLVLSGRFGLRGSFLNETAPFTVGGAGVRRMELPPSGQWDSAQILRIPGCIPADMSLDP
jgi:hypothetical protein